MPSSAQPADQTDGAPDPRRVLAARRLRLLEAKLYLVIGPKPGQDPAELDEIITSAIEGGVDIVQLRWKGATDEQLTETGERLARLCHERRTMFFINDRPDLVNVIGADGVHVGQDDIPVAEARKIVGPACLVGLSTHSAEQLARAAEVGADYAGVGPVHETPTKPGRTATGYRYVHHASLHAELPWFAIGGIDDSTVDRVVATGAERLVVVRAISESDDPKAAAERLVQAIDDRPRRKTSEERDAALRAELRPLEPGERPTPAALAAIFTAAIGLVNLLMLAIGYQPREALQGTGPTIGQIAFGLLALVLAVLVWRLKPGALLVMQGVLAVTFIGSFLALLLSPSFLNALPFLLLGLGSGALFYSMVRVLARAQIPPEEAARLRAERAGIVTAELPGTPRNGAATESETQPE